MRIGIDLGGTKIEGIALGQDGRELARRRIPTPQGDYDGTLRGIASVVQALEQATAQRGTVGVGIPGTISPATGLIKGANSVCLIGHAMDRDLQALLDRPVRQANDANCFALSEATDGAGAGFGVVFGVILGTGTGGGTVVDGRLLTGPNSIAGEWGHISLPWPDADERPGPACYCGKSGCVESFLSGPGLARDHEQVTGQKLAGEEIVARAGRGDAAATATIARYEARLAKALAAIINIIDPDVIVLGGGLSDIARLYENVPRLWQGWAFSDVIETPLRRATFGASSGVRGAAWLWNR